MTAVFGNDVYIGGDLTLSGGVQGGFLGVSGGFSAGGGAIFTAGITVGTTATISGAAVLKSTLDVSGTVIAAQVAKAWVRFSASAGSGIIASFNVATVSRSAAGIYRITFTNAMADASYSYQITPYRNDGALSYVQYTSVAAGSIKFHTRASASTITDADMVCATFYR